MAGSCPTRNLAIHILHVSIQTSNKKITFLSRKIDFLRHVIKVLSQRKSINIFRCTMCTIEKYTLYLFIIIVCYCITY